MGKHDNKKKKKNKKTNIDNTKVYKTQEERKKVTPQKKKGVKQNNKDKDQTKKLNIDEINKKGKKGKKGKKEKKPSKHPKLKLAFKIFIILFLLICVILAGVIAAIFFGVFGDDFEITKEELQIGASNSKIVDQNGNVIADLSGDEKRKVITLDQMAPYLAKAYIAIEDERFYEHNGVDFKRTAGAIANTIFGDSSYGGSTITQQLVKNITKDKEDSGFEGIIRKVKEWAKACQVERMISKDQILELYLNILYVGGEGNLHGVELGAEYYFNKSAKDLDLAECSFLAGINSSPNYYNPYKLFSGTDTEEKRDKRIKSKCLTVLSKMKELGYVTNDEEYNVAVAKVESGLPFAKGTSATSSSYSYHTDALIEQVITQVMEERGLSRELAKNYVYSSGLTIYSTVDGNIQARVEAETKDPKYIKSGKDKNADGTLKNDHTQAAMVIIDHKTGNVLGVSGGLGEKTGSNLNRATQSVRQPGSSIKPIAVISPALQEKVITASTVYDDVWTLFDGNYKPKDDNGSYRKLINIRDIIAYSQNVPEVKIIKELTPSKSIDYLRNYGVTSLKKAEEVKNSEFPDKHDEYLSLAVGGANNGISPLEMAAAYAAIANNGEYITPTFYTKVVDSNGNTVMTPNQERRRVISEQNAYIVKTILQEPVKKGTATYCAISGMSVSAKTGTTDKSKDRWLCGFTPYYAAACWYGYDIPEEVVWKQSSNPAGTIWDNVMTDIHKGLASAYFVRPSGIVDATVCKDTGCLASTSCKKTYKEIFTSDNMPTKCGGHNTIEVCKQSGKLANEYCPDKETRVSGKAIPPKEKLNLWKPIYGASYSTSKDDVTETCTTHKKPEEKPKNNPTNEANKTNSTNKTNTANNSNTANNNKTNATNTANKNNSNSGNKTNTSSGGNQSKPATNTSGNKTNTPVNNNEKPKDTSTKPTTDTKKPENKKQ